MVGDADAAADPAAPASRVGGVPIYDPEGAQARRRSVRRALATMETARTPAEAMDSAARDGRTAQASLLVMPRIRDGHLEPLLELLAEIAKPSGGEDMELGPIIPFLKLRTVHFARILVHYPSPSGEAPIPEYEGKPQAKGPPIPAKLLFSTDFDGPLEAHLDELLSVAGPGLDLVFGHCEGWPGHDRRGAARAFFNRHRVTSNTFYTGTMNRSVDQIRREAELRDRVCTFLDEETEKPGFPTDPVEIRRRIQAFVASEPALAWTKLESGPFPTVLKNLVPIAGTIGVALLAAIVYALSRPLGFWPALGWVLGTLAVLAAAVYAAWRYLGHLAATDPVIVNGNVKEHTRKLVRTEDRIVQNEMSSVIYIKEPLWFRGFVLRLVLAFINFAARYLSNQGTLAGIPSIHFARWVIVDGGRRLVFFSNFDGSWENYLGDFIDKSHNGLTAVWSNCVGFPRTVGLLKEGATNEQQFKAYSRDSQIPTQVWYSAYRWLSVSNINNNTRLRLALHGDLGRADAEAWLRRFSDGATSATLPRPASASSAPVPAIEVADLQGLVAKSYKPLAHAVYVPVAFDAANAAGARAWVGGLVARVTRASTGTKEVAAEQKAVNVAFTAAGLRVLGLDAETMGSFAREFQEGMYAEHRRRLLGDTDPEVVPEKWRWGGPKDVLLHAVLFLYAADPAGLAALVEGERAHAAAGGVTLRAPLDSITLPDEKEHFGFHDGIAQPRIAGLRPEADAADRKPMIPGGEVVLGYPNAYGKLPATPSVPVTEAAKALLPVAPEDPFDSTRERRLDLGKNGTYVVFRQLEQDVKAFWAFVDEQTRAAGAADAEARKRLAAKMVGRWPNGAPLARDPEREPPTFDPETGDAFMYGDDLHGERCPLGAHVRRSNPRDGMGPTPAESLLVADRHRLVRRGRAYGEPLDASFDPARILQSDGAGERGLHFITFNTDISRQFEFVQNTWINSMKFDGLYADGDPVVAPHVDPHAASTRPEEVTDFTVMKCPVRHRVRGIPRFVSMRGGAYLFMPGLKALQYLSAPK
jgi:Dyp-type peroxidase family